LQVRWWSRLGERLLGYEPVGRWRLYRIAPADRRRGSLPERVPVPRGEALGWGASGWMERFPLVRLAEFARAFLTEHPRHPEAPALRRLVEKAPLAQQVEDALRRRQYDEAEPALRALLLIDAADARARFLLGLCRLQAGDLAAAEASFGAVAPRMEPDADFHVAMGRCHEARGRRGAARASYERALELQPGHPGALERLAALGEMVEIFLGTLDQPERAFLPTAAYEDVIARTWDESPRTARFFLDRSHHHLKVAQPGLALRAADRALAGLLEGPVVLPAERTEALAARCRAQIALERLEDAAVTLLDLESHAPDSEWTASCRGHLLWARGERERAAESIRHALSLNANRIEDLRLLLDPGFPDRPRGLREALNHLLNTYPQSFAVKSLAACSCLIEGDRTRGVGLAREAARLGAGDDCLLDLSGTLGRMGLHNEVCRLVEIAGGWRRFLASDALLRSNVAASLGHCGAREAGRELWESVVTDASAHPQVRLRAREALRGLG